MSKYLIILLFLVSEFVFFSCKTDQQLQKNDVPIDCPLAKKGGQGHTQEPFTDVKKYIEFLERSDRVVWQKPDEIISIMKLKGSERIADIGAGSGYFTFRFAKSLSTGKVYAIDHQPAMLKHIQHKAKETGISNVDIIPTESLAPKVPIKVDIVFVCDMLHHVPNLPHWLSLLHSQMDKQARLIIIEFKEGTLPEGPPERIKISGSKMKELVKAAGFQMIRENTNILPYQYYYEFIK